MQKDWKSILTRDEFFICREKGTEPAFSGTFNKFYKSWKKTQDYKYIYNYNYAR